MVKRIRHPKRNKNKKEEEKKKGKAQDVQKKHFVLEVHDGNLSNGTKIGK